jgi:hypothetical protein
LESAECEKQYSGQFTVIIAIVLAGALPTQNKATGIKIGHFQALIASDWKILALKK